MSVMRVEHRIEKKVKGPHNKFCSGDGEGRKDKVTKWCVKGSVCQSCV